MRKDMKIVKAPDKWVLLSDDGYILHTEASDLSVMLSWCKEKFAASFEKIAVDTREVWRP